MNSVSTIISKAFCLLLLAATFTFASGVTMDTAHAAQGKIARMDVEFKTTDGTILRGWHYPPQKTSGKAPIIVMAHGMGALKEMRLDAYAEVFSAAGLGVLVYDHRNFGASDGKIRQENSPWEQIHDFRDAITFASTLPQADPDKIGVWGSSYSGGLAIVVTALDRRVKAVVSQVPMINGYETIRRLVRPDKLAELQKLFAQDRLNRAQGKAPAMFPITTDNPDGMGLMASPDAWEWFTGMAKAYIPSWKNEVTLRTVEMVSEFEPGAFIDRISPTPMLMLVATEEYATPSDLAFKAYAGAGYPKKLIVLEGMTHFDPYVKGFDQTSAAARDWFVEHLVR
ncbi:alpha/beta fold hydrolase [Desulfovibrio sp. OttesenSCG-928-A18]|nr:alpha/beta fold hydrolase [Desulfovibrio sp. OttesenSCG-928-A18]